MRPYETASVRGVKIKRLRSVRALSTGEKLEFETRTGIIDVKFNRDPTGEVTVRVPESAIDEYATVLALEFEGSPV
jgi:alpha-L-fucosidase